MVNKEIIKLKENIISRLDEGQSITQIASLLEEYWDERDVDFGTKMLAQKANRIDRFKWGKPKLTFSLIRHPARLSNIGTRRQTWEYDFDTDSITLKSEGKIPQSKPYKADGDADAIVKALVKGTQHKCIKKKEDLLIINVRKITELVDAPKQTMEGRVKRLKNKIKKQMESHPDFELAQYRNMLAYRRRC